MVIIFKWFIRLNCWNIIVVCDWIWCKFLVVKVCFWIIILFVVGVFNLFIICNKVDLFVLLGLRIVLNVFGLKLRLVGWIVIVLLL